MKMHFQASFCFCKNIICLFLVEYTKNQKDQIQLSCFRVGSPVTVVKVYYMYLQVVYQSHYCYNGAERVKRPCKICVHILTNRYQELIISGVGKTDDIKLVM